ncbi:hypothetical protein pb186bvf_004284 [Paramecium bursaria]
MQDLENLIDDRFKRFKQFQPLFLSLNYFKAEIESQKQLQNNKTLLHLSHNTNKSILEWKQQVNNYKYLFYADNLLALFSLKYTINENWSIKGSLNGDKEGVLINLQGQFINEQNYLSSIFSLRNDHTYKLGLKYEYIDDKNQMHLKTHLEFIVGSLFNLSKLDFSANKSYNQYTFYSGGNIEKQFNLWSGIKRSINNATIYLNFLQFDYRSAILMLNWKPKDYLGLTHAVSSRLELYNQIMFIEDNIKFGISLKLQKSQPNQIGYYLHIH